MKCDFCGYVFERDECRNGCSGCPMSRSCNKIKCPNCNYEMLEQPEFKIGKRLNHLFSRLTGAGRKNNAALLHNEIKDGDMPLTCLKADERGKMVRLDTNDSLKSRKLAAFGILPGNDIAVIQKYPAVVIRVGFTQVALDDEIASSVIVRKIS